MAKVPPLKEAEVAVSSRMARDAGSTTATEELFLYETELMHEAKTTAIAKKAAASEIQKCLTLKSLVFINTSIYIAIIL